VNGGGGGGGGGTMSSDHSDHTDHVLAGILIAVEHRPLPMWCVVGLVNALVPDGNITARTFGRAFRAIAGQTYTAYMEHGGGFQMHHARLEVLEATLDEHRRAIACLASRARGLGRRPDPHIRLLLAAWKRSLVVS
jgi:hypothetical protein